MDQQTQPGTNALLAAIPPPEQELLRGHLQRFPMKLGHVIQEPGEPTRQIYFPHAGVFSVIADLHESLGVEIATIGREGFAGLAAILEAEAMPYRILVQIPGEADRIATGTLMPLLPRLPALHRVMLRATMAMVNLIAQGSACNRLHPIEARCARWLLLTHDRVDGDSFPLRQEFLAQMLGVSRPSVSIAAGILQKAGLIHYVRGTMTVLDRPGLENAACECYGIIAKEFRRLVGVTG